MSQQYINIGSTANDGNGDPIRTAFQKTNDNFSQLFPIANVISVSGNNISVHGNITGNYFIGNGAYLTGISSGNTSTGNVTFDNVTIVGTGNLNLQPSPNTAGAFLDIFLTTGPDVHIAGNGETVIIGRDDGANIAVTPYGNVTIQSYNGNANVWTFGDNGDLTLPTEGNLILGGGVIKGNGASPAPTLSGFYSVGAAILSAAGNVVTSGYISATGNISAVGTITSAKNIITIPVPLANLTAVAGGRAFVSDANLIASGNFGNRISGSGSNIVPVWSDGSFWYIG